MKYIFALTVVVAIFLPTTAKAQSRIQGAKRLATVGRLQHTLI